MIDPQIFLARFRPNLAELGKLKVYTLGLSLLWNHRRFPGRAGAT